VATVRRWETELYRAIRGLPLADDRYPGLARNFGIGVYRELIAGFRRGSLARTLRYTMTLLLNLGREGAITRSKLVTWHFIYHLDQPA
jgi:hypothetical protein